MNKKLMTFLCCTIGITSSPIYAWWPFSKKTESTKETSEMNSEAPEDEGFQYMGSSRSSASIKEDVAQVEEEPITVTLRQGTESKGRASEVTQSQKTSEIVSASRKDHNLQKTSTTEENISLELPVGESFFTKVSRAVKREVIPTMFTTAMSAVVYHDYTQYVQNPEMGLSLSIIPASALALMEARNMANRFLSKEPSPWSLSVPKSLHDTARTGALLLPGVAAYGYSQTLSSGSGANDPELTVQMKQCVQSCLTGMNDL